MKLKALKLILPAVLLLVLVVGSGAFLLRRRPQQMRQDRYDDIIWEAASRHSVSPYLVKAVIRTESSFSPFARGGKGEIGLMQITPGAVKDWQRVTGQRCRFNGMLFDPRLNIEIGTWYLSRAVSVWKEYRDSDVLALAQYNAGPTKAREWCPKDPREELDLARISFPTTREYIRRVRHHWRTFERNDRNRD